MRDSATLCLVVAAIAAGCLDAPQQATAAADPSYYDLGGFHDQVTTSSAGTQTWFDRGLAMCYGFNHEEAVRCFETALTADPGMPMALWGLAYAWGPNINKLISLQPQRPIGKISAVTRTTPGLSTVWPNVWKSKANAMSLPSAAPNLPSPQNGPMLPSLARATAN